MVIEWSPSQKQRLRELGRADEGGMEFETVVERDEAFTKEVAYYQSINRKEIRNIQERRERHLLAKVEENIAEALIADGFLEVRTPTIISGNALVKMGIDHNHPLREQVFWLDGSRCLRPMLAPNLYFLMRHLKRNVRMPLQMFEIGTCYRKESQRSSPC